MINVDDVKHICGSGEKVIIDSREDIRYAGLVEPIDPVAGHIPGAINLPFASNLLENGHWKDRQSLRSKFDAVIGQHPCSDVIFYCGSGVTACHNILAFKHAGLGDALLYPGSWSEWITDPERGVEVSAEFREVREPNV